MEVGGAFEETAGIRGECMFRTVHSVVEEGLSHIVFFILAGVA